MEKTENTYFDGKKNSTLKNRQKISENFILLQVKTILKISHKKNEFELEISLFLVFILF